MKNLKKIMFVCHGNICRSPMAEFIFRELCRKNGCSDEFYVSSSAVSTEEIWGKRGNPMYPHARAELAKHGIPCNEKYAVLLAKADYDKYDLFIGMDVENIRGMMRIFESDPDGKISKLMDYTDRCGDVSDPWYSRRFDVCYSDIYSGCEALLEFLREENKRPKAKNSGSLSL